MFEQNLGVKLIIVVSGLIAVAYFRGKRKEDEKYEIDRARAKFNRILKENDNHK